MMPSSEAVIACFPSGVTTTALTPLEQRPKTHPFILGIFKIYLSHIHLRSKHWMEMPVDQANLPS